MRVQKRNPWLYSLGMVMAAMALWGSRAGADVTSDRPGSVVIWPKVIADGTRDTLITLTNTRNETAYAHCVYVNAIGICSLSQQLCSVPSTILGGQPPCPGGSADVCNLSWQADDFDVILTRQQPTIWRVSTGRVDNPLQPVDAECDNFGTPTRQSCPGFFLIGNVRPAGVPFRGELRCIQVTMDGSAIAANGLKGEATIETYADNTVTPPVPSTQISTYNSINIRASQPPVDSPSVLPLNGVVLDAAHADYNVYNACPEAVEFTNYSVGASDLVADDLQPGVCATSGCPVTTEITIIPCRADFEHDIPTRFNVDIRYTNEFEQELSVGPQTFNCWVNFTLEQLNFSNLGWTMQRTRINPSGSGLCIAGEVDRINQPCTADQNPGNPSLGCGVGGVCAPSPGVLSIVEEFHETDVTLASATIPPGTDAANAYSVDVNQDGFIGKRGQCRSATDPAARTRCTSDADCPAGRCRVSGATCSNISGPACPQGDFCDQCMNDELIFQPDVVTPLPPQ